MPTWTSPITWVNAAVYTEADFNAQIRDNISVLKLSRGDDGRFLGLSSSYLANLSGTNLTGIGLLASANVWANRMLFGTSISSTARLVVPVEGAYTGTDQGDLAVVGVYLYYTNNAGAKWKFQGVLVASGPAGAVPGSIWIEPTGGVGARDLYYIDALGDERRVPSNSTGMHSDSASVQGSLFMVDFLHWIVAGQELYGHQDSHTDTAHSDVAHVDSHSDVAHSDAAHSDSHSDVAHDDTAHVDSHSDTAHDDSHSDTHSDAAHGDGHGDHSDVGHADSHGDSGHDDSHGDSHSDAGHVDSHSDTAHSDVAHSDVAHSDVAHSDVAHTDTHTDTHTDVAHVDTHTDQPVAG